MKERVVHVLDIFGRPMMPTKRFGKVRRLLKDGEARVARKKPFTIQLLYKTDTNVVNLAILYSEYDDDGNVRQYDPIYDMYVDEFEDA